MMKAPGRQIPPGFAEDHDFMDLNEDLQKIREFSLALKNVNPAGEICDVAELKQPCQTRESEEKHRLLIENATDIISTTDLQGHLPISVRRSKK